MDFSDLLFFFKKLFCILMVCLKSFSFQAFQVLKLLDNFMFLIERTFCHWQCFTLIGLLSFFFLCLYHFFSKFWLFFSFCCFVSLAFVFLSCLYVFVSCLYVLYLVFLCLYLVFMCLYLVLMCLYLIDYVFVSHRLCVCISYILCLFFF